eukprot:7378990-Prymnesium_polylepis.1
MAPPPTTRVDGVAEMAADLQQAAVQRESESNHRDPPRPSPQTVASHAAGCDPNPIAIRNCARQDAPAAKYTAGCHTGSRQPHTRSRQLHPRSCRPRPTPLRPP